MTEQTQNADGQNTTDAGTQNPPPETTADTTALTEGGDKQQQQQTEAETTALTGDDKAKEGEGETTTEGKDAEGEADKAKSQVPEKYEFTAPEGVTLNEQSLGVFSETAKELGLTQEQAQTLVEKMAPTIAAQSVEAVRQARAEWKEAQANDKEFGGEQLAANLGVARKAMEAFGTPEFTKLLNQSGLGDHPEVIRVFYRAGKAISEDGFVSGNAGPAARDAATVMYPTMKTSA